MACQYYPPGPVNYIPYGNSYQGENYYPNHYSSYPPPSIPHRTCDSLWIPPQGPVYSNPYVGRPYASQESHCFRPPVQINHCIPPQGPRYCNSYMVPTQYQHFRPPCVPLRNQNCVNQLPSGMCKLFLAFQRARIEALLARRRIAATAITPRPSCDNGRSRAPEKRVTPTTPSTPPTPLPKNKNKNKNEDKNKNNNKKEDTHTNIMPKVHPAQAFEAQDAQVSGPDMLQRFVYSIDDGKTLQFVDPEDELVLDLAVLCKNAFKNARRSPPSYKCPCCVGNELPDVDHRMLTTCDINGERRQKIICPILLRFFKEHRASTIGGEVSS